MIADVGTAATAGPVVWAPGGITMAAPALAPAPATPGTVLLLLVGGRVMLCAGHCVGLHRLLIHCSPSAPRWLARLLRLVRP